MDGFLTAVCLIGALFALIALMPDFDGWRDGEWKQPDGEGQRPWPKGPPKT